MSKNGSVETPTFVAPIEGANVHLQPLGREALDAKLLAAFSDPRLYELACGLGQAPTLDYLQHVLFDTHDVTLWQVTAAGARTPAALAVYSRYTSLDRVAVYFWDKAYEPRALDLWDASIAALVEHVFAHAPQAVHVYVHLPLPVVEDFHNALMLQGFAPWGTKSLLRAPERAAYGLDRAVFDLYRQPVEDEEGLDGDGDGYDDNDSDGKAAAFARLPGRLRS